MWAARLCGAIPAKLVPRHQGTLSNGSSRCAQPPIRFCEAGSKCHWCFLGQIPTLTLRVSHKIRLSITPRQHGWNRHDSCYERNIAQLNETIARVSSVELKTPLHESLATTRTESTVRKYPRTSTLYTLPQRSHTTLRNSRIPDQCSAAVRWVAWARGERAGRQGERPVDGATAAATAGAPGPRRVSLTYPTRLLQCRVVSSRRPNITGLPVPSAAYQAWCSRVSKYSIIYFISDIMYSSFINN